MLTSLWGEPKFCEGISKSYLRITSGDINAFMFLFADNLSSLIAIIAEAVFIPRIVFGFKGPDAPISDDKNVGLTVGDYQTAYEKMVWRQMCPGIGVAILFGNVWYAWMAAKLAKKENRNDVTALPYGINTPAGFLTVFMVMLPILFDNDPATHEISPDDFAKRAFWGACSANFVGGLFEVAGIVLGQFLRRNIPRAALFGPVCGVGFVWLAFSPLIDVMREPLIGILPLFLCFIAFFANKGKGWYTQKVPVAFIIMFLGTVFWWCGLARHDTEKRELNDPEKMRDIVHDARDDYAFKNEMTPFVVLGGFEYMKSNAIAVQFPIALASFIETIENVEMAAIAGDSYNVNEAMLADGLGTIFGALFGSPLPTTVYIGHKRHKVAEAKFAYSLLNGLAYFVLFMAGIIPVIFYCIDPVTIGCVLIAVGLMIVQLALESSASRHYPCLMIGIMFLIADMLYFDHFDAGVQAVTRSFGRMKGVMNMAPGGGIMCSLVVPAILCDLVDGRFFRAAIFCFIASALSWTGLMHGANYHQPDGKMIPAKGGNDYFTTDLGEVTLSLPVTAKYESWQTEELEKIGVGNIASYDWKYKIDDPGFGETWTHAYNEGWRFAIAYFVSGLVIAGHGVLAKFVPAFKVDAIMDNGVATTEPVGDSGKPAAEAEPEAKVINQDMEHL